jgi:L-amino acid N-acyltransferase YncA
MIRIRVATDADAAAIAAIYAPHVIAGVASFEETPPEEQEIAARLRRVQSFFPWLIAEDDGAVVGYAYADKFRERSAYRWAVETTVYVAGSAQRRGIGRLLYGALLDILRRQGFTQAIAAISLPNDGSIRLHEQVGFRRAGVYREVGWKLGRWIDVGLWQAELADPGHAPQEPRPFDTLGWPERAAMPGRSSS